MALVLVTSAMGVAHAAGLGGVSTDTLDAWTMPADIPGDTTPPTITATVSPTANGSGWNRTVVTVTFVCTDGFSGVASCTAPITVASATAGQVVTGHAVDRVGNTSSRSVTVRIDLAPPAVAVVGVSNGAVLAAVPSLACTASDALSGVSGSCTVSLTPGVGGQYTVVATARDVAGNVATATATFQVLALCGTGPTNVPCVVPLGTVLGADLTWNADVLVLGEAAKHIDVDNGSVTVGSTGIVGDDITQTGAGGVTVLAGGRVDKIKEAGEGSVSADGIAMDNVEERDGGDLTIGPNALVVGSVKEFGAGSLTVAGQVTHDVEEEGDGNLTVSSGGTIVDGHVKEVGAGSLVIDGEVHKDVEEQGDGDLTVGASGSVEGKVKESGLGSVYINGVAGNPTVIGDDISEADAGDVVIGANATVNGTVKETGLGDLTVAGLVTHDVTEEGDGNLLIAAGGTAGHNVVEKDAGSLTVNGLVQGSLEEQLAGDLTIGATGRVNENSKESGDGSVFVWGVVVKTIEERDLGDLTVGAGSSIGIDALESGVGNLVVAGPSSIGGKAKESNDGDLTIGASAIVGVADASGAGTCTISPQATVTTRTGSCT